MLLSRRMQANANLISPCESLADVGCDHGYLPIWLIESGVIRRAIALDINEGPLARARENIRAVGLSTIETRLSDGLAEYTPGETDAILIAGMGGKLVLHILRGNPEAARAAGQLVLQPQSEIPLVRRTLLEAGYHFLAEDMVEEDGKWYPMMKVVYTGETEEWSEADCRYGRLLIEAKHPVLGAYLIHEHALAEKILSNLPETREDRIAEVRHTLELNEQTQLKITA